MPLSDFTTPCSAICSMSRHFLPVLHPEPIARFTTGLTKGSRFPVMAYFLSSRLSALGALSPDALASAADAGTAAAACAATFGVIGLALAAGLGAAACFIVTAALGAAGVLTEVTTGFHGCVGFGAGWGA